MVLLFSGAMQASPINLSASLSASVARVMRGRPADGPTSFRAVIVSSFFFVFIATALLLGGHAAVVDPLLRSVIAARSPQQIGDIVYVMPDGRFCRRMSFDNITAEVVESTVEPCPGDIPRDIFRTKQSFAWGGR